MDESEVQHMCLSSNHVVYRAPSKKLKATGSKSDYISDLPESVITHILSRLPTKDAVNTSTLSRDWKYKWTSIYNFYIDDHECNSLNKSDSSIIASFSRFVYQTLLLGGGSRIKSFHLVCSKKYGFDHFENWIPEVLKRNVQDLKLVTHKFEGALSSHCFSGWTSLTELNIHCSNCTLNVSAGFVNLKSLFLISNLPHGIRITHDQSHNNTNRVALAFPVLEVLELKNCKWLDVKYVEIQAPELLRFKTGIRLNENDYEIKVCAPKLFKYESIYGRIDKLVVIAPAVTHAHLYQCKSDTLVSRASMILKGFRNLKCLRLGDDIVEAFVQSKSLIVFNTLVQLKRLQLDCECNRTVFELLGALPSLESLEIDVWEAEKEDGGEPIQHFIMSHLKVVKFNHFSGSRRELEFAEAIMKRAKNLHSVFVTVKKQETEVMTIDEITCHFSKLLPRLNCALHVEKHVRYVETV